MPEDQDKKCVVCEKEINSAKPYTVCPQCFENKKIKQEEIYNLIKARHTHACANHQVWSGRDCNCDQGEAIVDPFIVDPFKMVKQGGVIVEDQDGKKSTIDHSVCHCEKEIVKPYMTCPKCFEEKRIKEEEINKFTETGHSLACAHRQVWSNKDCNCKRNHHDQNHERLMRQGGIVEPEEREETEMRWRLDRTITYGKNFTFHEGCNVGKYSVIGENVEFERNVEIGKFCIIEDGCYLEEGVVVSDYVRLGKKTHICKHAFMDSYTISSGECYIGSFSQIRYQSIIARNTVIGDDCFLCAGVKTAYLDHMGNPSQFPLEIGAKTFIGDNSTVLAGLKVANGSVIGAHSLVTKNIIDNNQIYVGCPAKFIRDLTPNEIDRRETRFENLRLKA